jgi:hypothetical protein
MNAQTKSIIANILLIAVVAIWVIGVEYTPVMKGLGLPLTAWALSIWAEYSTIAQKYIK